MLHFADESALHHRYLPQHLFNTFADVFAEQFLGIAVTEL
jgi:hypothetical protein